MIRPDTAAIDSNFFSQKSTSWISSPSWTNFEQTLDSKSVWSQGETFLFQSIVNTDSIPREESNFLLQPYSIEESWNDIQSSVEQIANTISSYNDRIELLEKHAELDGYSLNIASRSTFWNFFRRNRLLKRGRLVLIENGNLRAVWKDNNGAHIGLQFLENGLIQYVIFKQRSTTLPVSRVYGRDTTDGTISLINTFDLGSVLYT